MGERRATGLARRVRLSAALAVRAPLEARFPFRPLEAIERVQRRRLAVIVAHAYRHVPYYRETMRRLGLGPEDFTAPADLAKLPVIERDDLQRDPEYFLTDAYRPGDCLEVRSGGSTGEPVTIFRHPDALFAEEAHRERLRSQLVRLAGRRVRFTEASVYLPSDPAGARSSFARRTLLPSSIRVRRTELSALDPPHLIAERIDRMRPDVIVSYGSYLEALFDHLHALGRRSFPPRVAVFTSDELGDRSRRLIREQFGIEVLGYYRAIEAQQLGFECDHHRGYHQNIDLCPIRILAERGREAAPGETGEVISSNLILVGTVLLNYRLGDLSAWVGEPCGCGRTLPLISYVRGRPGEWLVGERGPLHGQAIRDLMRLRDDVLRYQVVQRSRERIEASVVAAPGCDRDELAAWIRARFAERLGAASRTEVRYAAELPRTAGGKTLRVVSEVKAG
jgi:phenylacetate-CoA ligase